MNKEQPADDVATPGHAIRWPWWLTLFLCLAGLLLSILLERIHFKSNTDPTFQSFCAIDRKVNCDIVARSSYAVLLGVPVATWGILAYAVAAVTALWGLRSRRPLLVTGLGLDLALAYVAASVGFAAVSIWLISAVCLLCIATYAINVLFLGCMVFAARAVGIRAALAQPFRDLGARPLHYLGIALLPLAVALALMASHPAYWHNTPATHRPVPSAPTLPHGVEPGGGHFIGALDPVVTVVEFSDYECPFCRVAHTQLRSLVERFPTRLRVVHRHYPLDLSCNPSLTSRMHENACFAAMIAECAGRQNRFWQANDYLFAEARMMNSRPISEIAHDIGLDATALESCLRAEGPRSVGLDVDEGNRLNIRGTPTFLVEGKTYTGNLPPWVLGRLEAAAEGRLDAGSSR
jgi:protein-disulfide isomerase/uncharacterized membrane protein